MEPKPTTETSFKLECSAEWHLARIDAQYAPLVYSYSFHLSKNSGRFFLSVGSMATYLGAHPRSIGKAFRKLCKAHFFERLKAEPGKSVAYRPVPHREWARKHPGCCLEKVAMPWSGEKVDALVTRLYAASDGELQLHTNWMVGIRKLALPDDVVVSEYTVFDTADSQEKIGRYARFMKHLRNVAASKDILETRPL